LYVFVLEQAYKTFIFSFKFFSILSKIFLFGNIHFKTKNLPFWENNFFDKWPWLSQPMFLAFFLLPQM